jgi:hypothetical protein
LPTRSLVDSFLMLLTVPLKECPRKLLFARLTKTARRVPTSTKNTLSAGLATERYRGDHVEAEVPDSSPLPKRHLTLEYTVCLWTNQCSSPTSPMLFVGCSQWSCAKRLGTHFTVPRNHSAVPGNQNVPGNQGGVPKNQPVVPGCVSGRGGRASRGR